MSTQHWSRVVTLQANTSGKQSRVRIVGGNLGTRDLLSYVTFLLDMWPILCCFSFGTRENWCSCASVVIFSNSVVINSLSSFSVPFSVISTLRSARCMSLLSVGVVEYVDHHGH